LHCGKTGFENEQCNTVVLFSADYTVRWENNRLREASKLLFTPHIKLFPKSLTKYQNYDKVK